MSPDEAEMTSVYSFIKNPVHFPLCCYVSSVLTVYCFYLYKLRVPPEMSIMRGREGRVGSSPPMFQAEEPNC